jgi:Tol biopolymer transport system component
MPDFDTRKPKGANERSRPRMSSTANGLRGLLTTSKLRILLMAGTLRRFLMANRLRTLLIGGGMVLFVAAAALGLLIYSSSELAGGDQKDNDQHRKTEDASLTPLEGCPVGKDRVPSEIADTLREESSAKKVVFVRPLTESDYISVEDVAMYRINADGTSLTRLTETTAKEYGADRLPDGRRLGIVWDSSGKKIYSLQYGIGGQPYALCSPDGKKVAYVDLPSTSSVEPADPSDGLYVRTDHGTKKLGYEGGSDAVWSPDSEKLAFLQDGDVYVAKADGSDEKRLTNSSFSWDINSLAWSPDSEKIAFVRVKERAYGDAQYGDLYVIKPDGTGLSQLTNNAPVGSTAVFENVPHGTPVFSPDGNKIAFLGHAPGEPGTGKVPVFDLYVMNADGSGLTDLSERVTSANEVTRYYVTVESNWLPFPSPSFSPDSKHIAFVSSSRTPTISEHYPTPEGDVYAVNVDGTGLTRLTQTDDREGIITWVWK